MSNVLAVIEVKDGAPRRVANEVVTAARALADGLGGEVHALIVSGGGASPDALGAHGADVVYECADDSLAEYQAEGYTQAVAGFLDGRDYAAVLFGATSQGKDLAPRVAGRLRLPLASDVTGLEVADGDVVATRPVYAGKAIARVHIDASPALVSVRPNVFTPVEARRPGAVETVEARVDPSAWKVRRREVLGGSGDRPDVGEAPIVVSGGRGMQDPANWGMLEELRDALGPSASLGASRAVVDAGWRPHAEQVGQTGKTVSPQLYFAVGISGAIQHLAGMRTAGTIVAINKDPDAPIFKVADYGVVGDAFEVLPRLAEEIRRARAG
ncbi:MAG TPA: electron transfer flavoprotein subunit alpha/FixB family protein [Longimicrobiales bacterium]|nr:electron transfer flavoprotein subunit alpha/FixB family protein [Longimicrobiales bacterium]